MPCHAYRSLVSTTGSNSISTEFNVFDEDNYLAFTADNTVSAININFDSSDGRWEVQQPGVYKIAFRGYFSTTTTQLADLRIKKNGTTVWTSQFTIHSSVDPVYRGVNIAQTLSAGDYIEVTIDGLTTTLATQAGTHMVMRRIDPGVTTTKNYLSIHTTSTSTGSASRYNPFDEDNYVSYTFSENVTAFGASYTQSTGVFNVDDDGIYEISCDLMLSNSSSQLFDFDLDIDSTTEWTTTPLVHGAVDPVGRSMCLLFFIEESVDIEVFIDAASGTLIANNGCAFNLRRID